jgi:hypothetical protein
MRDTEGCEPIREILARQASRVGIILNAVAVTGGPLHGAPDELVLLKRKGILLQRMARPADYTAGGSAALHANGISDAFGKADRSAGASIISRSERIGPCNGTVDCEWGSGRLKL